MPTFRPFNKVAPIFSLAIIFLSALPASANPSELDLPLRETIEIPTPAYKRHLEVIAKTQILLQQEDFDGLEALAKELRESKARLDGGTWILSTFYNTADSLPEKGEEATIAFFERWAKERPESITAQVCLANIMTSYAWRARGTGWADSVTEKGWQHMRERLARAENILTPAAELTEKCPGLAAAAQRVALGQGWDRSVYLKMVSDAIAQEPTYGKYYTNTCYWLTPRWHGEPGDIAQWIAEIADGYSPEKQDRQYAFLVWMADLMPVSGELLFEPGQIDWDRTKRGFANWLTESPDNLMVRFQFIRLALLANDASAAREQFAITGGKYFPRMWSNPEQFEAARKFAFGEGPNPLLKKKNRISNPRITPEVRAAVELLCKLTGRVLGGLLAGLALFILAFQRRQIWVGVLAFFISVLVAPFFGTLATIIPGGLLFLYLRRKHFLHPPEIAAPSGWIILLWAIFLPAFAIGLQIVASIFTTIPHSLEQNPNISQISELIMSNGTSLLISVNANWITFLALLAICNPQNRLGWQNRLGLHNVQMVPGLLWASISLLFLFGLGQLLDGFMDARSREALRLMALGIHTPVIFYFAIVLVAPVVEELIFRGYIYSGWIDKIGFWGTATATSMIFTACHIQYGFATLSYVFLLGMILSALRWKTGSIYPGIAVHAINNLFACLMMHFIVPPS